MKGRNYRSPSGQPYTRLKYIHGTPVPKVSKFNMGDLATKFQFHVHLVSRERVQIRHNALESARVAANKVLFDKYGDTGYLIHLRPYPHIILRENKMIATAGADRLQEGMRRAFGKPTGRAARVDDGQQILTIGVNKDGVETAKKACEVASTKFPMRSRIVVEKMVVAESAMAAEAVEVGEPVESVEAIEPGEPSEPAQAEAPEAIAGA